MKKVDFIEYTIGVSNVSTKRIIKNRKNGKGGINDRGAATLSWAWR